MKREMTKQLWKNGIVFGLIFIGIGFLLYPTTDNVFLLISTLVVLYVVLLLWLSAFFVKYVKPVDKATEVMRKILQGNYHVRVHEHATGAMGELNYQINALARDLSKLKIQEQIQSEQLSTVVEHTESGLVLIDEKGYIHLGNRKFYSMFDATSKQFVGRLYYDVITWKEIQETVQHIFLHEDYAKTRLAINKGTDKMYIEVVGAPIFNEFNILKGAVLAIHDISDFKRLELMRKDFVANVSHELKTPITSIRGFAETLLDDQHVDEKTQHHFLSIIHEESDRIHRLIDDLLTLSQLERDSLILQKDLFDLGQLMKETKSLIDIQAKEKGIQLQVDVEEKVMFYADQQKIKQVLLNLLTNAISYTSTGGDVSIHLFHEDNIVTIKIKDTGIGIEERRIPRLFERFYRVDKARSRDTGGTGLGLAIVKHIVELHEGTVEVTSTVGVGTEFVLQFPIE